MSTYLQLRDAALNQVGCAGQAEAQTLAQVALQEAMKYVAFHVRVPSLIASATATAPANPTLEANAITLDTGGFNILSTFQCIDRLYIKKDSTITDIGTPYEYLEYHYFQDEKSVPANERVGIINTGAWDCRPKRSYTITPGNALWAYPLVQNNVLTLVYRIVPAVYGDSTIPEVLPMFDYILVKGAVLALKEFLREPDSITTMWDLFDQYLMTDCQRYDLFLNGQRKRTHMRIHRSYRTRT